MHYSSNNAVLIKAHGQMQLPIYETSWEIFYQLMQIL